VSEFSLTASCHVIKQPERFQNESGSYVLITVAGVDDVVSPATRQLQQIITTVQMIAFGGRGDDIFNLVEIGDRVVISASIRALETGSPTPTIVIDTLQVIARRYTKFMGTEIPLPLEPDQPLLEKQ